MQLAGSPLRVLVVGPPDAHVAPGGGEVQMASTVAALAPLGMDVRVGRPDERTLRWANCVHLFGSRPEHLPAVEAARRAGVPVALSTIAWFDWADYWRGGTSLPGRAAAVARFAARAACPRLPSWRRRLYHSVDLLLPNSTAEARQLVRYFGVARERIRVIPNGADPRLAECNADRFVERHGLRDFVLCPGRIEPRKNQLGLIRAMRGSGVALVILGRVVPGHESYLDACRREADANVRFLDRLEHDDPMLGAAYAACGCLALASWFETPGLVALEAAMSGTPLVLPEGGAAAEYFGPHARYVRPNDYRRIRRAVFDALAAGRSRELADHVRENFSWDAAARATAAAYDTAVDPQQGSHDLSSEWWHALRNEGRGLAIQPRPSFLRACHPALRPGGTGDVLGRYRYVRLRWRVMFAVIDFLGGLAFRFTKGDSPVFRSARCGVEKSGGRKAGQSPGRFAKGDSPVFRATVGGVEKSGGRKSRQSPRCAEGDSPVFRATVGGVEKSGGRKAGQSPGPETRQSPGEDPRSILVIQLDHMGDAILSTGMLAVLRRRYPRARIEVLAGEWNRGLFEAIGEVDRVHVSRVYRFSRTRRFGWPVAVFWWGWRLRRRRFDLGIDVRGEFPLALVLWLCGARRRLGWAAGGGGFLLTDSPQFVPNRPETESRGALLAELGIPIDGPESLWPTFHCPDAACEAMRRRLDKAGLCRSFIAVHVAAGTPAKQWPVEHWRTLIGRLVVEHGLEVVLLGGPADRELARAILEGKSWPGVHDWTGRTSVVELAALMAEAAAVVGADSGPVHLAAAVGRPVVALFSGTNRPEQWRPQGPRVTVLQHAVACSPCHRERCPHADHPCMSRLRPDDALTAVLEAMEADELHREVAKNAKRSSVAVNTPGGTDDCAAKTHRSHSVPPQNRRCCAATRGSSPTPPCLSSLRDTDDFAVTVVAHDRVNSAKSSVPPAACVTESGQRRSGI